MRNNVTLQLQNYEEVGTNQMGRPVKDWKTIQTFDAFILPLKRENVLREFGIFIDKPFRVVTKTKVDFDKGSHFFDGKKRYKITETVDLKYQIFLVEEVLK